MLYHNYREVIAEKFSTKTDRPDYSLTLNRVTKIFVKAKKPSVCIESDNIPVIQTRKYGWNANHKISVLTNFEYFIIYDSTILLLGNDSTVVVRYRIYNYLEYLEKLDEIKKLASKESVYSGNFDKIVSSLFTSSTNQNSR